MKRKKLFNLICCIILVVLLFSISILSKTTVFAIYENEINSSENNYKIRDSLAQVMSGLQERSESR